MRIRNKTVFVYDIEIFQNIFHCIVKDTETGNILRFEISKRKNQLSELVKLFKQVRKPISWGEYYATIEEIDSDIIFCGYNSIHYDNPIMNYIIEYEEVLSNRNVSTICDSLYNLSRTIVTSTEDNIDSWKRWKYQIWFSNFDLLTMLYSNKLRVGLKEMQVTMQYPNVQEFTCDWSKPLPEEHFESMIEYNINDVESTEELLNRCKEDVDLRISIENEYGVRVLSKDGVNIGMQILAQKYLEKTNLKWWDIKDLRSPLDYIHLNSVILPFIKYKDPILQNVLSDMKESTVSPGRKGYENKFVFRGLQYSVGVGGIHSVNKPETVVIKDDEMLIDCDVASLYPSMLLVYDFYPKHLGPQFKEVYAQIRTERLEAKHNGNKTKDITLKLALNGLSGNLQNEHNFCYSPFAVMCIRINGQLLLLMLAEALADIGCRIIQANTDGLFVIVKKKDYDSYKKICKWWENLTQLVLEDEQFEAMYQYAINDYIAVKKGYKETKLKFLAGEELVRNKKKGTIYKSLDEIRDDYIKQKGMFITKVKLGKGLAPKIIPEAVIKYFVDDIPIDTTLRECTDIRKFLMSQKVDKKFEVEYNNELIQRINRFYASTNGAYLYKCKVENLRRSNFTNLLTASGVTILNKFDDIPITDRKINYRYYFGECMKIIEELKPRQLSLW